MSSVVSFPEGVLVADDEPTVLKVVKTALERQGIQVTGVGTGEAAVEQLGKLGFGCLLVDKNLPGISGLDVIKAAGTVQPHCATVVMTAYASTASAVEALRLGATDYIEKPFADLTLLVARIQHAMSVKRAHFERDRFMKKIRDYEAQLNAANATVVKQRGAIELLEEVIDQRVRQVTEDLRAQSIAARGSFDSSMRADLDALLTELRAVQHSEQGDLAAARSVLSRLAFRIESYLKQQPKKPK